MLSSLISALNRTKFSLWDLDTVASRTHCNQNVKHVVKSPLNMFLVGNCAVSRHFRDNVWEEWAEISHIHLYLVLSPETKKATFSTCKLSGYWAGGILDCCVVSWSCTVVGCSDCSSSNLGCCGQGAKLCKSIALGSYDIRPKIMVITPNGAACCFQEPFSTSPSATLAPGYSSTVDSGSSEVLHIFLTFICQWPQCIVL